MIDTMRNPGVHAEPVHPWVAEGHGSVRFGIVGGPRGDWPALSDFVRMVEELGFDSFWRPDHPLLLPDCWTILAAVAATTHQLRLGSLVSCVYYRNPVPLARIVADVDDISRGRVVLGLGAGDMEGEFRSMGLAYPTLRARQAALAEALEVVPRLLRGEEVIYQGSPIQVTRAAPRPHPERQPYVPLLVGGGASTPRSVSSRGMRTPPALGRGAGAAGRPPTPMCGGSMPGCGSLAPKSGGQMRRCSTPSILSPYFWPIVRQLSPPSVSAYPRNCSRRPLHLV
jgi:hypothetical protein